MVKLLLAALVVATLVACGPRPAPLPGGPTSGPLPESTQPPEPTALDQGSPQAPASSRTTIRFAVGAFERPAFAGIVEAFEAENPALRVELVSVEEVLGTGATLLDPEAAEDAEARLAAAADVINMGASWAAVRRGLLRDLEPFLEDDASFQDDNFYSGALDAYRWSGGTWALPTMINYQLVFFDRDLFDQAGVAYPAPGWTWDELQAKARALTARSGGRVTRWGLVLNNAAYRLVESQAGPLDDYDGDPPAPRYADEEVVAAVRRYADLVLRDQASPYFDSRPQGDAALVSPEQALIDAGQAAMWIDAGMMWWIYSQRGNIGVAPFPTVPGGPGLTPASVGGLVMSAGTRQPDAAWRWMDFVGRQPFSSMTMGIKLLPARRSVAEASGYWDDLDAMLADTLDYAVSRSYLARQPLAFAPFQTAVQSVISGGSSVDMAMARAQEQAEAALQQAAGAAGAGGAATPGVPAPQETPARPPTTIVFVPAGGARAVDPLRELAALFQQDHPGIVVDVHVPSVPGVPDLASLAGASDCFEWYPGFQHAEDREAVRSLSPLLAADAAFRLEDYLPQAVDPFLWQGELLALPADITPYIIEYNRDLLDSAGVSHPSADWTWEEFLSLAVVLTRGEGAGKRYGFVAEFYEINDLLLLTERLGARLIDDSLDPPAMSYDHPDTVEALRWYAALTTEHAVKPVFVTDVNRLMASSEGMLQREALIAEGRAAMWTVAAAGATALEGRADLNVGAVPPPMRADGSSPAPTLTASGYFISAASENPLACWQWITFLSGQPSAVQGLPARLSVATSDAFRARVGASRAEAYLASVTEAGERSALQLLNEEEWLGGALYWYGQAFGQVIEGRAGPEEALAGAQRLADDYRACVMALPDSSRGAWQTCVRQVDPSLPAFLFPSGN
jgi:ABC-type glycerol-3-phosphate transport system substrate-binding protein